MHRIEPVIDHVYALSELTVAYQTLERGSSDFGKLAMCIDFEES